MAKANTVCTGDILIIGGGIAGLTLAALLGRAGAAVHLVETSKPDPLAETKETGRTVALMQSSLHIVQATGIWDKIKDRAAPLRVMRIIDDSTAHAGALESEFPAEDIGLEQFGFNIPNTILRAALFEQVQKLESVTLHVPRSLESYSVEGGGILAILDDGTRIQTPLIAGLDGRKSSVRTMAGIGTDEHRYGQSAITCLIHHSRSHDNTATEFHRPGGPLALVPLPGNRSGVVWVEKTGRAEELIKLRKSEFTETLERQSRGILGGLSLETGPECWPLCAIRAKSLTAPRTVLAAEAAHVLSPVTAQGLNLSLRDVAALAETLIDALRLGLDIGANSVLARYAGRRSLDIATRVRGVDAMNRIVSQDIEWIKGMRRTGLKTLDAVPPLKRAAMRQGLAPSLDEGRLARGEQL